MKKTVFDPQAEAFNPYSYSLKKGRASVASCMLKLHSKVFEHRGVECWRVCNMHFAYVKDGIVIAERAGYGEKFIDIFMDGTEDSARGFHDHERPQRAYAEGLEALKTA